MSYKLGENICNQHVQPKEQYLGYNKNSQNSTTTKKSRQEMGKRYEQKFYWQGHKSGP